MTSVHDSFDESIPERTAEYLKELEEATVNVDPDERRVCHLDWIVGKPYMDEGILYNITRVVVWRGLGRYNMTDMGELEHFLNVRVTRARCCIQLPISHRARNSSCFLFTESTPDSPSLESRINIAKGKLLWPTALILWNLFLRRSSCEATSLCKILNLGVDLAGMSVRTLMISY